MTNILLLASFNSEHFGQTLGVLLAVGTFVYLVGCMVCESSHPRNY